MLNVYKTKAIKHLLNSDTHNPTFKLNQFLINKNYLISSLTGGGKTNFLINYISRMSDTFTHVYIFTKKPDEILYAFLKEKLGQNCSLESIDNLVSLKDIKQDKTAQKLIIFDDFINSNKAILNKIDDYAIAARKYYFTCFFITQKFTCSSLKLREQIWYLILLKMADKKSLNDIVSRINTDITKENIINIIKNAIKYPLNACVINMHPTDVNKQFRRNFTDFYKIVDDLKDEPIDTIEMYNNDGIIN